MSTPGVPADTKSANSGRTSFFLIVVCFFLSGFAALLYETVWLRQFAIILGTSEQALAVILASYMGGLSFGAWLIGKRVNSIGRPVLFYGILEAGIALCAIAMPWGLQAVEYLQVLLFGGATQPPAAGGFSQTLFGLSAAFGLIVLPTAMMGATLPLLVKQVVHRNSEVGPRIGFLYGINTLGAVAGTIAAAFAFLPTLGLRRTTWVGAAINLAIFALVYVAAKRGLFAGAANQSEPKTISPTAANAKHQDEIVAEENASPQESALPAGNLIIWFAAVSGAVSFCYEIVFTRMLSHMLGGSVFAFATMLAGFLLGIAFGGMIGSRLAARQDRSVVALIYAQALAGVFALLAFYSINAVAGRSFEQWGGSNATYTQVVISILILLPTATCIGATFPLATRIFAKDESDAASGSAKVYFFSTVGGIAGALLTGVFLLPSLAYHGATVFAILINALIAALLVLVYRAKRIHFVAALVTVCCVLAFLPGVPQRLMRVSAITGKPVEGDLVFSRVGRSGTVALFDQRGDTRFMTNGLPESFVAQKGFSDSYKVSGAWLSALPPLMGERIESMLIIGLGGGVAPAFAPPSVRDVDVFELEPAVVEANRFVSEKRSRDPLSDHRVNVILNDGRNGLALTSKTYDAIVSQPSHPWTAGASHLYTREFVATVHQHLEPGGVFLQWLNTQFMNPKLFRSLSATLLDVFEHVQVYEPMPGNCLFIASDRRVAPESGADPALNLEERDIDFYAEMGVRTKTDLFSLLRIDEPRLRELTKDSPLVTDEFNSLAMGASKLLSDSDPQEMNHFLNENSIFNSPANVIRDRCPSVNPISYANRLSQKGFEPNLDSIAGLLRDDPVGVKLLEASRARLSSNNKLRLQRLREAIEVDEKDSRPAFLLLAHDRFGTLGPLEQDERRALDSNLDEHHASLMKAIDATVANDMQSVMNSEPTLASVNAGDTAYELAVRLRILWRLTDQGPNRVEHNQQALDLITRASPFMSPDSLVTFRCAAAIGAERPEVAIASLLEYAKMAIEKIKSGKVQSNANLATMRNNLIRCREMVDQKQHFRAMDRDHYQSSLDYLDRVIAGDVDL